MDFYFAKDIEEQVESRLHEIHEETPIQVFHSQRPTREIDYKFLYDSEKFCLPYSIRNAVSLNRVDRFYYDVFFNGIKDEHPTIVSKGIEESIQKELKECHPPEVLHTAITDKISNLVFQYNKVLAITRERDNLQGIHDEEKIIINHLNRYYHVLNSPDLQLELSIGLLYSKEISDLFVRALIRFLEKRLSLLNPQLDKSKEEEISLTYGPDRQFRFVWGGSQKELLELIVMLQKNNWINSIPKNQLSQAGKAICNLFDINGTKKSQNTDPTNLFIQILKGEINQDTSQREYDKVYMKGYKYKFDEIKPNN